MLESLMSSLIQAYGNFGLFIVMVVQTIIAPIPSEALIVFAGSLGLGIMNIIVFAGSGMVLGSVIAFWIARWGREAIVERLIGKRWLKPVDKWVNKHGTFAILAARLVPVIPFDLVSYVSGLTSLKFSRYLIATILGAYPRTALLALLGIGTNKTLTFFGLDYDSIVFLITIGIIVILVMEKYGIIEKIEDTVWKKVLRIGEESK
ncbi:MAG: VTT domain-containing protein [Candidatus Aenigmarchaeota archaeon]|nr:VTT domain-containing protein [Candidatus Aenigmarchaeota archaeon]